MGSEMCIRDSALVDWALEVVNNGVNVALPQILATQVFEHNKPLVVRD